jgi:hypothetical protein
MIEAPVIQLDFFQKLMLLVVLVFGGAIMFNIHRVIDWIRELDNP